jgi:ribosome-associated heat shock protein Hsp15
MEAAKTHVMRLDQWLWAVRVYKTRNIAAEAIKGGLVKVADEPVKPSREVKPGDIITARVNQMTRTVVFLDAPKSRVGAKLVAQFMEDRTPPEEYHRRREANLLPPGFRPQGSGRPTKRERREIDSFDL